MGDYINFNGTILRSGDPVITVDNRGFRYGDGIFETMFVENGLVRLKKYHFDRLSSSLQLLQFEKPDFFTKEILSEQINNLCKKNGHQSMARARLMVFRGKGGLFDPENHFPNYIIESWPIINESKKMRDEGLRVEIFPDGRKSTDVFSNLKSNNFLLYTMAALYATKNKLDDCLVLNSDHRICESMIANIFCIKNQEIFTPSLSEGCVSGVMRRFIITELQKTGLIVHEKTFEPQWLSDADEIFLTNAISVIRWVKQWRDQIFRREMISDIYPTIIKNLS
ncbi:MAG: aminotransferase class IV [Bacteroidetes bacterium]|nr:aminotransferase class IV [Bacteroidota bacterium]